MRILRTFLKIIIKRKSPRICISWQVITPLTIRVDGTLKYLERLLRYKTRGEIEEEMDVFLIDPCIQKGTAF